MSAKFIRTLTSLSISLNLLATVAPAVAQGVQVTNRHRRGRAPDDLQTFFFYSPAMETTTPTSHVYVLRLLPADELEPGGWRALLVSPQTGARRGFSSLEALFEYLRHATIRKADNEFGGSHPTNSPDIT